MRMAASACDRARSLSNPLTVTTPRPCAEVLGKLQQHCGRCVVNKRDQISDVHADCRRCTRYLGKPPVEMKRVEAHHRPAKVHVVGFSDRDRFEHRIAEQLAGSAQPALRRQAGEREALRPGPLDLGNDSKLQQQLGHDARGNAPEQVGCHGDEHRRGEDEQLLAADVRHVPPDFGRTELVPGVENNRPQYRHRHQVDQVPPQEQIGDQEAGVKKIGPLRPGAAQDASRALDAAGDDRQTASQARAQIGYAHCIERAVRVRLAAKWVDLVDGRDRRQRLDTVDQCQGQDRRENAPPE